MEKDNQNGFSIFFVLALVLIILILGFIFFKLFFKAPSPATSQEWVSSEKLIEQGKIEKPTQMIQINISYDREASPSLQLKSVKLFDGYKPKVDPEGSNHKLVVLDGQGIILDTIPFTVQENIVEDTLLGDPSDSSPAKEILIDTANFTLTTNYSSRIKTLNIINAQNKVISTYTLPASLDKLQLKNNGYGISSEKTGFLNHLLENLTVLANDDEYLDLVYVGDGFDSRASFESLATQYKNSLLALEPFKHRQSQIRFFYVFSDNSLGCEMPEGSRLILCDPYEVINLVQQAGVPWDKIMVVINSENWRGAGGNYLIGQPVVSATSKIGANGMNHELGHGLGGLVDEYVNKGEKPYGEAAQSPDGGVFRNCYRGDPPRVIDDPNWEGVTTLWQGCNNNTDWWRSTTTSIMNDDMRPPFNLVSQRILDQKITYYAGLPKTNTPEPTLKTSPSPSPSSSPSSGAQDFPKASSGGVAYSGCGQDANGLDIPCYKIGVFDESELANTKAAASIASKNYDTYSKVLGEINSYIGDLAAKAEAANVEGRAKAEACVNQ